MMRATAMTSHSSLVLIAARQDEALTHGQVMYGLIKPTKDMNEVESTAAMVNVIPKKRTYRMESIEEVDLFITEMMKRPLVIQPSAFIGRGIAKISCALYTKEERWIVMVNQSSPMVKEKVLEAVSVARSKMGVGEPFIVKLTFNEFLKKIYLNQLTKANLNPKFTCIDFEDAEIIIRYPGDVHHQSVSWELKTAVVKINFNDLDPRSIERRTVQMATLEWNSPALRIVPTEELHELLPGWQFNEEDLAAIKMEGPPPNYTTAVGVDEEQSEATPAAPSRIVGRAKRKANNNSQQEVPVELHVLQPGGPQVLHRGNVTPSPTNHYENLDRQRHENEHPYSSSNAIPMTDMSRRRGEEVSSQSQRTPTLPDQQLPSYNSKYVQDNYKGDPSQSSQSPGSPRSRSVESPHSPVSPQYQDYNRSPTNREAPQIQQRGYGQTGQRDDEEFGFSKNAPAHSPAPVPKPRHTSESRYGPPPDDRYSQNVSNNRYNSDSDNRYNMSNRAASSPSEQHQQQGGAGMHHSVAGQRTPSESSSARNGDLRSPSGYPSQPRQTLLTPPQSANSYAPTSPSPRGFHNNHQGSGRSESSTSDSGFGDHDGETRRSKGDAPKFKAPYYNHAFEQEHHADDGPSVDDIMAQHKALAARMMQGQGQSQVHQGQGHQKQGHQGQQNNQDRYGSKDYYNDSSYNKELQKWRQNINDLENAYDHDDQPVNFSPRSRLQLNSNGEKVDESFI